MEELISPQQSETLILVMSAVLMIGGALYGLRVLGVRGLSVGLLGPLVFGLWQFHKWITRYDPQTGYFGLDKVKVLLLEIVVFVTLGVALGWVWNKINFTTDNTEDAEEIKNSL